MARCIAMAAILDFAIQRQTHTEKLRGLLLCCSGGVQDAYPPISSLLYFSPIICPNFTGLIQEQGLSALIEGIR